MSKYYNNGDIISKHDNEICYSKCVTTGLNLVPTVKISLDSLPARHPTLVRPRDIKIDTPLGMTKNRGDMRRVRALLDKTMADSQAMLDNYKIEEHAMSTEGYFGVVSMSLVCLALIGLCAWSLYRCRRKKNYKPVADNHVNETGLDGHPHIYSIKYRLYIRITLFRLD